MRLPESTDPCHRQTVGRKGPAAGHVAKRCAYSDFASRCNPVRVLSGSVFHTQFSYTGRETIMPIVTLPITLVTAGAAAILALWLGLRTGGSRRSAKVSIGDGGDDALITRMRAQANYVEYAPFIVILVGAIELTQGSSTWLWVAAMLFLVARVLHPLGMDGLKGARMAGTLITFILLLGLGGYAVALPLIAHYGAPSGEMEAAPAAG